MKARINMKKKSGMKIVKAMNTYFEYSWVKVTFFIKQIHFRQAVRKGPTPTFFKALFV